MKKYFSQDFAVKCGILALPFLLFNWMIPFISGQTLGTDYINYHIYHHLDLLFSVKSGSFPLYAPACYYGQSSVYPHAQLYHPAAHLISLLPGFWQGYSLEWLTLYRLLSLAVCHLFLFQLLRKTGLVPLMAFLISLVTVYNLQMLSLFWNAIALDAYTGTLFLCIAVGRHYLEPGRWYSPLLMTFATYWLISSDFPPYVFYGGLGAVLFTLTWPFLSASVSGQAPDAGRLVSFWRQTAGCLAAGILLSAAYLLPFFLDYMRHSSGRIDQPYLWSIQWTDTPVGFINNFFYPLGAGFSMFGGTPLFLLALLAPITTRLMRIRVPGVIWVIFGAIIICFLYMQGDRTPVHQWAWRHVPLVSALRGPVRIAMVLPLLFMMVLAWLTAMAAGRPAGFRIKPPSRPIVAAAAAALMLTGIYWWLPSSLFANPHYACPSNFRTIPDWIRSAIGISGMAVLGLIMIRFLFDRVKTVTALFLLAFTVFQLILVFRYGPYAIATKEKTPTWQQLLAQKQAAINSQPVVFLNQHAGSRTVVRQLKNYFMEPQLAKIYRRYTSAVDLEDVYRQLNGDRTADEAVIENFPLEQNEPSEDRSCAAVPDRVSLTYSSYNRLAFSAQACQASFFVFSYPYSGHWQARLNGRTAPIYRANGAAQGVYLSPGRHVVEFFYRSRAALSGMIISCLTLALLGGLAGLKTAPKPAGYGLAAAAIITAAGIFYFWQSGLYTGDNLGTRYEWQTPPADAPVNIAFGKPTLMSSHTPGYPDLYNSRHAVDGGRGMDSCFITGRGKDPWWMVDLKSRQQAAAIVLFIGVTGDRVNTAPLRLSISTDGEQWQATPVGRFDENGRAVLVFDQPRILRYVKISVSGETMLSLNEVEVYATSEIEKAGTTPRPATSVPDRFF